MTLLITYFILFPFQPTKVNLKRYARRLLVSRANTHK